MYISVQMCECSVCKIMYDFKMYAVHVSSLNSFAGNPALYECYGHPNFTWPGPFQDIWTTRKWGLYAHTETFTSMIGTLPMLYLLMLQWTMPGPGMVQTLNQWGQALQRRMDHATPTQGELFSTRTALQDNVMHHLHIPIWSTERQRTPTWKIPLLYAYTRFSSKYRMALALC